MAELTTPAFRKTIKFFSNDVVMFSEMLSAGAVLSRAPHNRPLTTTYEFDTPFIYQIVGDSPEKMSQAAKILSESNCYGIDINMGCSAPVIIKKKQGARLLTEKQLTKQIIKKCRKAVTKKLSVKIRSGYSEHDIKLILEYINLFQDEGIDFITVHPRFAKQSFKGTADWEIIRHIKEHSSIPLVGNGDISDPLDGITKLNNFACDGIMIGREAVKSPWIFQLLSMLYNNKPGCYTFDVAKTFTKTLQNIQDMLPVNLHRSRSHRFSMYFVNNVTFSHGLFSKIRNTESINDMISIVNDYFNRNLHEKEKTVTIKNSSTIYFPGKPV